MKLNHYFVIAEFQLMLYGASSLSVLIVMIIRDLVMEQHRTLFYTVRSLFVKIEYFKTLTFFILASTK